MLAFSSSSSWPIASSSSCRLGSFKCCVQSFSTSACRLDHYKTLGVTPSASKAQIKSHYYQLSKKHHPDVSKDPSSKEVFSNASLAYSVLVDDRQRRAYDRSLLHRSSRPMHSHSYEPRAPPTSGHKATHAWAHPRATPGGFRKPPPDYSYTPPRNRGASASSSYGTGGGQHYTPPKSYPDVLRGTRKKDEEEMQQLDRIRNTSGFMRMMQVVAALALSLAAIGGMPGGS
ncbi:hypothetical protein AGABI2DRAFT_200644 [Agaricus bisporus var. bisporus H97]|uniref:hypothetical protein n=1 Tax=Agaricus bisporus var. bisporus (strain H97 / ATCC MYA-4626 / FGSC 10389) TaxID=936046 RepID=UPI00029F7A26|nr:hypothetical protein AGABI2DRAFT_200644 [Agaricus bisporus var. bisporus H97]EKV50736.1 hypothetical protein AGABI2DRAFT_200644 [Agaricus bisporus var. bisporus H97]